MRRRLDSFQFLQKSSAKSRWPLKNLEKPHLQKFFCKIVFAVRGWMPRPEQSRRFLLSSKKKKDSSIFWLAYWFLQKRFLSFLRICFFRSRCNERSFTLWWKAMAAKRGHDFHLTIYWVGVGLLYLGLSQSAKSWLSSLATWVATGSIMAAFCSDKMYENGIMWHSCLFIWAMREREAVFYAWPSPLERTIAYLCSGYSLKTRQTSLWWSSGQDCQWLSLW